MAFLMFEKHVHVLAQDQWTTWSRAVQNAERAAAQTADTELDVSSYTLGLVGYRSQFSASYTHYFSAYVAQVSQTATHAEGELQYAILSAGSAAKAAHFATWAKTASDWGTYGHNAAMIQLDRVKKNGAQCVEYAQEAGDHAKKAGVLSA